MQWLIRVLTMAAVLAAFFIGSAQAQSPDIVQQHDEMMCSLALPLPAAEAVPYEAKR